MTRTEDDLRTLLRTPVEPAVAARVLTRIATDSPRSPRRRRHWQIGLVTALAVVVVVGAVLAAVGLHSGPGPAVPAIATSTVAASPTPSPSTAAPVLRVDSTVVSFAAGSGFVAGLTTVFADEQSVDAVSAAGTTVATVRVSHDRIPTSVLGSPIDIGGGATGVRVVVPGGEGTTPVGDGLAWSVAGLTVTVSPNFDGATDADVEAVARAVVVGSPVPLRVPVSSTSWPAGWSLDGLVSSYAHRDGPGGDAGRDVLVDLAVPGQAGTAVTVDSAGLAYAGSDDDTGTPVEVGGVTWRWDAGSQTFTLTAPDRIVRVTSLNAGIGRDQLQTVIASLHIASSFADESTWFDASTALPS